MNSSARVNRILISNYRSIAKCDLKLGQLVFLVGPNGSGKSNFLDAMRLVSDALQSSLDHALRDRGGINEVRRRSSGHPTHLGVRIEFQLPTRELGHYAFRIGAKKNGSFLVQGEECWLLSEKTRSFRVEEGVRRDKDGSVIRKGLPEDRLHLVAASSEPEFRPVFELLANMAFYSLNPDRMRELQTPDAGELLHRDGGNAASVLRRLADAFPENRKRIQDYLALVVPGVLEVEHKVIGPKETISFKQEVAGAKSPWNFLAANMSDGTLRALGILLGLFQKSEVHSPSLIGIEEPEIALHPAAAAALLDALREASQDRQTIVTSHSPDLLDLVDPDREGIIAVNAEQGTTKIAPIDAASKETLRAGLYTPGELLRLNQLEPDPILLQALEGKKQLALFDLGNTR
ncbi:MAG: AAA family ATPase [Bryobacter sp.]|nr:AAA family ATPase [Bryobacter sp.]